MIDPMSAKAISKASQLIYSIKGDKDDKGDEYSLYLLMKEGNEMGKIGSRYAWSEDLKCITSIVIFTKGIHTNSGVLGYTTECICRGYKKENLNKDNMLHVNMASIFVDLTPYLLGADFVFPRKMTPSTYENLGKKWVEFLNWNDYDVEKIY